MTDRIITPNEPSNVTIGPDQVQATKIAPSSLFEIRAANGQPYVTIHPDGRLEHGDGYNPDEAAKAFWEAVQCWTPTAWVREFGAPLASRINTELAAGQEARKKVERLDQMATAWKERLPDTINRDTVVEAVHQVTRPDGETGLGNPRQSAYDAVFAYIRQQPVDFLPTTVVARNAMIWDAVHAALDAVGISRQEG